MAALKMFVITTVLVAAALADERPLYGHPGPYKEPEPVSPPKYSYNNGVADGYSADGYYSYTVDLPDGRTQIVKYVDNGDGLIAEVTYKGEAVYPEEPVNRGMTIETDNDIIPQSPKPI